MRLRINFKGKTHCITFGTVIPLHRLDWKQLVRDNPMAWFLL